MSGRRGGVSAANGMIWMVSRQRRETS